VKRTLDQPELARQPKECEVCLSDLLNQASVDVAGGAPGSPVILQSGHAVGMVSGGYRGASTDFYLPLERPKRALQAMTNGQVIVRVQFRVIGFKKREQSA